ncbi:MAG TPA: sigma-70 family RNA polymerase sigma factor [Acidimicrobiia bacterium]|nr:sigma-70 family RNA polymerase sigma factor [Acidimicrobiia bacterium]
MIEEHVSLSDPAFLPSFEGFYRASWQQIYRAVAISINDPDLGREAVDEAMVRAYERWKKVSTMANPEGWVFRVALNWAVSRLRRRKLRFRSGEPVGFFQNPEMADLRLVEAVRRLPHRQREVVVARYLLDMSEADTAQALGIPRGTVKSRLSRALSTLKEVLS